LASIVIGSDKITCHKALLAFYSEFFDGAFYGQFVEAEKAEIILDDISVEEVKAYIGWLYTGQVKSLLSPEELWVLGDRLISPEFSVSFYLKNFLSFP